jgi:hypothetical protein
VSGDEFYDDGVTLKIRSVIVVDSVLMKICVG